MSETNDAAGAAAMKVAFIGVGTMGAPMAACIARSGHTVTVYDSSRERAGNVATEHGCRAAAALEDLASADFIVTMLPTGQIVRDLYLREGLAGKLVRGTIAIDMSSSNPTGTRELGAALAAGGITLLDAPVSGGVPRAMQGKLTIMIGGDDPAAIERARPLLSTMGDRLFDTGGLGSGHAMKALNNFVAAASFAACAEALLTGQRFGLDPKRMVEILNVSTGRNFHTDVVLMEHVVGGKFASGFQLGLLAKDVAIAADLAQDVALDAPLVHLVSRRFDAARDALGYARDHTEAIKAWDASTDHPGTRLKHEPPVRFTPLRQEAGFDLAFRLREPVPAAPRSCLFLLHGNHGRETAPSGLADRLDPESLVVFPRGPIELADGQFTWFNIDMSNESGRINPREAEAARHTLLRFVRQIQAAYSIDPNRSIIAGFSQGAAMSASVALTAPEHFAGLGILSGRILAQVVPQVASRDRLQHLRAFVGHGKRDKVIPVTLARQSDRLLSDLGVVHVAHEYSAGHAMADKMRSDFQSWVADLWDASRA